MGRKLGAMLPFWGGGAGSPSNTMSLYWAEAYLPGYSPRPPTPWDRNEILRSGCSSDVSSKIRISSKSVKRFRSCGGSKFAHPIDLAIGLYNSLYNTIAQAVILKAYMNSHGNMSDIRRDYFAASSQKKNKLECWQLTCQFPT